VLIVDSYVDLREGAYIYYIIYIYICIYIYIYLFLCICIYVCIYVYIFVLCCYVYMCIYACIHVNTYIYRSLPKRRLSIDVPLLLFSPMHLEEFGPLGPVADLSVAELLA
jgi:hypothetical protein